MPVKYIPRGTAEEDRFSLRIAYSETCWNWVGPLYPSGYGSLILADGRRIGAHIYAWWLATGEWPAKGMCVCHACDDRTCTRNDTEGVYTVDGVDYRRMGHLWLGTKSANSRDRALKGRTASGDRNGTRTHPESVARGDRHPARLRPETHARGVESGRAKLSEAQVLEMRALVANGMRIMELTQRFPVKYAAAYRIVTRITWKHI